MRAIFGLGSILMVVLIIGVLAAMEVGSGPAVPTTMVTTSSAPASNGTTTTAPSTISQASVAECISDAQSVETAIGAYDASNLTPLGAETSGDAAGDVTAGSPATYARATNAAKLVSSGYLSAWPASTEFAISLSTSTGGDVEIYVPATSTVGVDFATESPSTGCNAL